MLCSISDLKGDSVKNASLLESGALEFTLESDKKITTEQTVVPAFKIGKVTSVEHDSAAQVSVNKHADFNT